MTESEEDSGVMSQATDDAVLSHQNDLQSDDDEPVVFTRKRVIKRSALIDSDSDDCSNTPEESQHIKPETSSRLPWKEKIEGSDNVNHRDDDSESCESSGNECHNAESDNTKTRVVAKDAESLNCDENDQVDSNKVSQQVGDSSADSREPFTVHRMSTTLPVTRISNNNDLFDAEMEDSDSGRSSTSSPEKTKLNTSDKDGESDEEISAALKRKIIKGAAKKSTKKSSGNDDIKRKQSRPKKEEILDLHSETQRLVRTAAVKLPYHQPEKKDLSSFLARAELRRQQLVSNSSTGTRQPWKRAVQIEPSSAVFAAASISASDHSSTGSSSVVISSVDRPLGKKSVHKEKLPGMSDVEPSSDDDNDCVSPFGKSLIVQPSTGVAVVPSVAIDSGITCIDSDGGLPDLDKILSCSAAGVFPCNSIEESSTDGNVKPDICPSAKRKLLLLPNIESTAQEVLASSGSDTDIKKVDPCLTPVECLVTKKNESLGTDLDNLHLVSHMESDPSNDKKPSTEEASNGIETVPTAATINNCTKLRRAVGKLTADIPPPHLSGMFGETVSLDDDLDESQLKGTASYHAGVEKLMERLVSHSRGARAARKAKTIEIRTVCKEKISDEREELALKTFTYKLDANEDENVDPTLNKPGARLGKLRARLTEQMRAKRDEALAKRYELFGTRYGEASGSGYEAKRLEEDKITKDEEAELTDQTDTDEESEVDSELDEEERVVKSQRESNPYFDEEADEDDDDGDSEEGDNESSGDDEDDSESDDVEGGSKSEGMQVDSMTKNNSKPLKCKASDDKPSAEEEKQESAGDSEESLHLCLEDDEDSQSCDLKQAGAPSKAERIRLQRANTFEVFDEDANTESPTISQRSNEVEDIDAHRRSFVRLSGDDFTSDLLLPDPMITQVRLDDTLASVTSLIKESSITSTDSTFEMLGSLIPGGQQHQSRNLTTPFSPGRKTPELFTPSSKSNCLPAKTRSNYGDSRDVDIRFEENDVLTKSTPIRFSSTTEDSFNLVMENATETQSCSDDNWLTGSRVRHPLLNRNTDSLLADSQGDVDELLLLCSGSFQANSDVKKPTTKSFFNSDSQQSEHLDSDELLGLCSGKFSGTGTSAWNDNGAHGSLFTQQSSTANSNSLLDVLSGKFTETQQSMVHLDFEETNDHSTPLRKRPKKRKAVIHDDDDDIDGMGSNDLFEIVSNKDEDDEVLSEGESLERDSDSDEGHSTFTGFIEGNKKVHARKEFFEEEAELSGSEYDSDENVDLDENDDIMEQEAGDADDVGTEEELRNQVHRVHLKNLIDEDDREIRLLQEQYLTDGDLHSDGFGRMRRFRWQNTDDDNDETNVTQHDNELEDEDEGEKEAKWRTERLEREKFLEEHKDKQNVDDENDSQLLRLGKTVLTARNNAENYTPNQATPQPLKRSTSVNSNTPVSTTPVFKVPSTNQRLTHGSFLGRSKEALAKITELVKPVTNMNGPRSSRNFVFSTVSPDEKPKAIEPHKLPQGVQRSVSVTPPIKRPRLDRSLTVPQMASSKLALLERNM